MKNYRHLIIAFLFLVIVIGGAFLAYQKLSDKVTTTTTTVPITAETTPESEQAKDFTVYDSSGKAVKLSDFTGKPVVVNFWATWCPPCKAELPHFNKLCSELEGEVVFLMVDLTDGSRETVEGVNAFVKENSYTFPVYFDTQADAAYAYSVSSIPMTLFIDRNGTLVNYQIGMMEEETLRNNVEKIR